MSFFLNKKISTLLISWLFLLLIIIPISSCALEYEPLEPDAFGSLSVSKNIGLGNFLSMVFNYGIGIAGALAVVMIVWGGVEIMLSESVFSKDAGKKKVKDAIMGLLLALFSWLILNIINPEILKFKL